MDTNNSRRRLGVDVARLQHTETLLADYPEVSSEEEAEILRFLKKARALDVALLTAAEDIRPQLDRFRSDHRREFQLGPKHYLGVFLIVLTLVVIGTILWDAGLR